ncbi:MAG: hypothetical protein FJ098_16345, partial [Deltaproteobacteria bacterium]|nr:hypothetical protein [Deltaproteobacteria bacterium]
RVEQRIIGWSEGGDAALLYQRQTCVPHLPPVSLWHLEPGEGRVVERLELWGPSALVDADRSRARAFVSHAGITRTPFGPDAFLPGILVPHPDPELRERGLMGSPFLGEELSLAFHDGEGAAASEACAASFPCAGLCLWDGTFAPGRRWLACAAAGPGGAELPVRYVRILTGPKAPGAGGQVVLDLERELGTWNGRVLREQGAPAPEPPPGPLPERLLGTPPGETETAAQLLAEAAERCSPEVWAAARRFLTVRGLEPAARARLLDACLTHVAAEDADLVYALATDAGAPLPLRVAAGRALGRLEGETPRRLKTKLYYYHPPPEVMDAIRGR